MNVDGIFKKGNNEKIISLTRHKWVNKTCKKRIY